MARITIARREGSLSTRQTYRFTGLRAHEDAIATTRDYLDDRQWGIFMDAMRAGLSFGEIRVAFMIVGVEGYPVSAMLREYHVRYVRRFGAPSKRPKLRLVQGDE